MDYCLNHMIRDISNLLWEKNMMNNIKNIHLTASLRDALGPLEKPKKLMMENKQIHVLLLKSHD